MCNWHRCCRSSSRRRAVSPSSAGNNRSLHSAISREARESVTSEREEVSRLVRRLPADLIVLCHSLSRTECTTATLVAKHDQPRARTLLMVADGDTGEDDHAFSELADDIF